jgi:hypothetical protein
MLPREATGTHVRHDHLEPGDEVMVVEHNDADRTPKPDGIVLRATVTVVGEVYVQVRYHDDPPSRFGFLEGRRVDAFYRESGWRAWDGAFRWRLASGS